MPAAALNSELELANLKEAYPDVWNCWIDTQGQERECRV